MKTSLLDARATRLFSRPRRTGAPGRRRFRPALETLEGRALLASQFVFSGFAPELPAGVPSAFSVTAKNSDGSTDALYAGTLRFHSSDAQAVLPADCTLTNGSATLSFTLQTPGTQSITAVDTVLGDLTGSLSTQVGASSQPIFSYAPNPGGGLIPSSRTAPQHSTADVYAYDSFVLAASQTITEIDWRGGYFAGHPGSRVTGFSITIFDSIPGGSQPAVTHPELPETYLAKYEVGGDAGETAFGVDPVYGIMTYDYQFALPTPFQAAAGRKYWLRIEASQAGTPDWGLIAGTGGDGRHFRFRPTVGFDFTSGDAAFTLLTSPVSTATLAANAWPAGGGTILGGGAYPLGATATLTASPNPGFAFVNWTENGTPVSTSPSYSFVVSADRTLSANFAQVATILTLAEPSDGGSTGGDGTYLEGSTATIVAAPNPGFGFVNWATVDGTPVSSTVTYRFTVSADRTLVANFRPGATIAAVAKPDYAGSVSGPGVYSEGSTVTAVATPNPGFGFVNWTENGTPVSTAASYGFTVSSDRTLAANFAPLGTAATFDFDSGTPALVTGQGAPFAQTRGALSAHFSGLGGDGFSVQTDASAGGLLSRFSGHYLCPDSLTPGALLIDFDRPLRSIVLTFATADFEPASTPATLHLAAYQDSVATPAVGAATAVGTFGNDPLPTGTLSFQSAVPFDLVVIDVAAGSPAFFLDDVTATAAEAGNLWHNSLAPCDVNGGADVTPLDALVLINYLNTQPGSALPARQAATPPYYDVNDDQLCTALDVLLVINYLNRTPLAGEGESSGGINGGLAADSGALVTTPSMTLTGLKSPWALAFDSSGSLYVANFDGNTVSRFAPGSVTPTATLTGVQAPRALAFDANGNLYVANATANGTVSKFAPGDTTPSATLTGVRYPNALAFDDAGNLYVANDIEVGTVSKFAPGGTTPGETLTGLNGPVALAFDSSGNLYVANFEGNTISRFAPGSTTPNDSILSVNNPTALAFDGAGNLYATSLLGGTISRFAPGGTTPDATLTGLQGPSAMAFDAAGNLYVANYGGDTVSRFAPGGTTPSETLTGITAPTDLALDAHGNLYVTNFQATTVSAFYRSANPWRNASQALDANGDQQLTPLDVLVVINYLNAHGPGVLPAEPLSPPRFLDVDGNWAVTALDALIVINHFNALPSGAGEGEAMARTSPALQSARASAFDLRLGPMSVRNQLPGQMPDNLGVGGLEGSPGDVNDVVLSDIALDVFQGWERGTDAVWP